MVARASLVAILVLAASGCSLVAEEHPASALPGEVPLATGRELGPNDLCSAALARPFTVHGDQTARPAVWGINNETGQRVEIIWPYGTRARLDPDLVITDADGHELARAGSVISDAGGGSGPNGEIQICSFA